MSDLTTRHVCHLDAREIVAPSQHFAHLHVCLECGSLERADCMACSSFDRPGESVFSRELLNAVSAFAVGKGVSLKDALRMAVVSELPSFGKGDDRPRREVEHFKLTHRLEGALKVLVIPS